MIDLFSVTLNPTIGPGTYSVDFSLLGQVSGDPAEDRGANGNITITATPEPSTMWLMATGLIIFATTFPWFVPKKSKPAT